MFGLFRRPSPEERARADAIKALVRARLGLGPEATVSVSEIDCGDAACPGLETVILVMRPGARTEGHRFPGPLLALDDATIIAALGG